MNSRQIYFTKKLRNKRHTKRAGASRPRPLCVYLEAEVLSKEYLFAIHYSFVISNNILAHNVEFLFIFRLIFLSLKREFWSL